MTGRVTPFAGIFPERVVLSGRIGAAVEQTVIVKPSADHPFALGNVRAQDGRDISVTVIASGEPCCPEYLLRVVNTRTRPGRYADTIVMETDSPIRPTLAIPVLGNIN